MEILKCYRFFSRQNPTLLLGSWNLVLVLLAIWQLASAQHVFQVLSNFSWIFTGVEGDGRDVEEVEDEAVEAVVATRSRWSSSRRRRMYIYSYVNGEFHVWCWHEAAYTVTRCSWAIRWKSCPIKQYWIEIGKEIINFRDVGWSAGDRRECK